MRSQVSRYVPRSVGSSAKNSGSSSPAAFAACGCGVLSGHTRRLVSRCTRGQGSAGSEGVRPSSRGRDVGCNSQSRSTPSWQGVAAHTLTHRYGSRWRVPGRQGRMCSHRGCPRRQSATSLRPSWRRGQRTPLELTEKIDPPGTQRVSLRDPAAGESHVQGIPTPLHGIARPFL